MRSADAKIRCIDAPCICSPTARGRSPALFSLTVAGAPAAAAALRGCPRLSCAHGAHLLADANANTMSRKRMKIITLRRMLKKAAMATRRTRAAQRSRAEGARQPHADMMSPSECWITLAFCRDVLLRILRHLHIACHSRRRCRCHCCMTHSNSRSTASKKLWDGGRASIQLPALPPAPLGETCHHE